MILRWTCKDCDTRWIYPVDTCIHCGGEIIQKVGTEIKVVGVTKVSIPSVSHPIVPYHALILQDENGNRMPKKSMKEYNLGDKYEWVKSDDEHAVSIVKNKYDIPFSVKTAIELLVDTEITAETKIFIKPSIMTGTHPYFGLTTNPEVLEGTILYLKSKGAKEENMIVGEIVQFGDFAKAVAKTGIAQVCKEQNIKLVNLLEEEFEEKKSGEYTFKVSKIIYDYGLMVNIPVMKTHMMLGIAGALENMTRVIHPDTVKELMTKDINQALYRLHEILPKNQIVVGDCTIGGQSNGPLQYSEPAFLNRVLASKDSVALDKVFQEMCLLRKSPHVETCGEEGIGENELMHIPICGDELDACRIEIKQPIGSKLIKKMM